MSELMAKFTASALIKVFSLFSGFLLSVLLARYLGAEGYGVYAYVFSVVSLIAIPIKMGLPELIIRETAKAKINQNWGLMAGLWSWADRIVIWLSLVVIIFSLLTSVFLISSAEAVWWKTYFWGFLLIPTVALGNVKCAALIGLNKTVLGQFLEHVIRPGVIILLLIIYLFVIEKTLKSNDAMMIYFFSSLMALLFGFFVLSLEKKTLNLSYNKKSYAVSVWLSSAVPLALISGMYFLNQQIDILFLGLFDSAHSVGIYKVVSQLGVLVIIGQQFVRMVVSPRFAGLYEKGDMVRLHYVSLIAARISFSAALLVSLSFIFFGYFALSNIFGTEYGAGYLPLVIICIGQLINSAFGSTGNLLNMSGHEKDSIFGLAIATLSNIVLNLILIPLYGVVGAAIATSISVVIWNVFLYVAVRKRLGFNPTVFSKC